MIARFLHQYGIHTWKSRVRFALDVGGRWHVIDSKRCSICFVEKGNVIDRGFND